jgi:hypothetical protein
MSFTFELNGTQFGSFKFKDADEAELCLRNLLERAATRLRMAIKTRHSSVVELRRLQEQLEYGITIVPVTGRHSFAKKSAPTPNPADALATRQKQRLSSVSRNYLDIVNLKSAA